MPTRNSGPELKLRSCIHRLGLRFGLHATDLPGRPDLVFRAAKVAVFVDGCFWHGCPEHGILPKNNRHWWRLKLLATRRRDRAKDRQLKVLGWLSIHVWEHEDMAVAGRRLARAVGQRLDERKRT
jgi:DNA mismatch endonuclease (patch repair protein)